MADLKRRRRPTRPRKSQATRYRAGLSSRTGARGYGDARCVNDMGLNVVRAQPARHPEAIAACLEGHGDASHPASCFLRFLPAPHGLLGTLSEGSRWEFRERAAWRSGAERLPPSLAPIPHRLRPHVELSRTPTLSAACNIMRARNANCCEVERAGTSASSASRCATTITGSAANRGIATSLLSFRFVMPQRCRFDSPFVAKKQRRSAYPRTFTQGGVVSSA